MISKQWILSYELSAVSTRWRSVPNPDREIEVTCEYCPECDDDFDESVGLGEPAVSPTNNAAENALRSLLRCCSW